MMFICLIKEYEMTCLSGDLMEDYLYDLKIMQYFAALNREAMIESIVKGVNYPWSKDRWACDYPVVRYKLLPLIRCGFRGVALMG